MPEPASTEDAREQALRLHEAMLIVSEATDSLYTIVHHLRQARILWPTIRDLEAHREDLQGAYDSLHRSELSNLARDLGIWIVEHYYQPQTFADLKRLTPDLLAGGFERLLRACWEREGESLTERQDRSINSLFEDWIQEIWDKDPPEFMQQLEHDGVATTGQLIRWLCDHGRQPHEKSLDSILKKLEQLP